MGFQTTLLITAFVLLLISLYLRLIHTLPGLNPHPNPPSPRRRGTPAHLLIVLGSGGHTAEIFSLLHSLDPYSYTHRSYIISEGDDFSALKAEEFEKGLAESLAQSKFNLNKGEPKEVEKGSQEEAAIGTYSLHPVPRARRIHQSLFSTPFSSLLCLFSCLKLLRTHPREMPDLILLNGPGTAVIVVFASLLFRFFGLEGSGLADREHRQTPRRTRTIYIESWARVQKLSLSGRILAGCGAVDRLLVQWEPLKGEGGAEWMGWMVR